MLEVIILFIFLLLIQSEIEVIPERKGKIEIEGINGAQHFTSDINSNKPEELLCCIQKDNDMKCFGYNIIQINLQKYIL